MCIVVLSWGRPVRHAPRHAHVTARVVALLAAAVPAPAYTALVYASTRLNLNQLNNMMPAVVSTVSQGNMPFQMVPSLLAAGVLAGVLLPMTAPADATWRAHGGWSSLLVRSRFLSAMSLLERSFRHSRVVRGNRLAIAMSWTCTLHTAAVSLWPASWIYTTQNGEL